MMRNIIPIPTLLILNDFRRKKKSNGVMAHTFRLATDRDCA